MFNVTVIRLRDIVKILALVIIIYILGNFIFNNIQIKNRFNQIISLDIGCLIKIGINSESSIFKYVLDDKEAEHEKTEEIEAGYKDIQAKTILNIGTTIFDAKENDQEIGQDSDKEEEKSQNTNTNSEEQKTAQAQEVNTDISTQVVTQNPIAEKYNREYNGVKIKNETSYELTDDMLNTDNLDINKKDIIMFHTHTCESYTQTENYKYEPSRKLQNNRPKFFSS